MLVMQSTNGKKGHFSPQKKLNILREVSNSWSVTDVCIYYGIRRSTYYRWKKQYEVDNQFGLNRLKNSICIHPNKINIEVAKQVVELSVTHAEVGCCKIAKALREKRIIISSPTVQKILIKEKLGKKEQRLRRLEKLHILDKWSITDLQAKLISKIDTAFKHRNEIGSYPGEILVQDAFPIFDFLPDYYLYVVIDTYSYHAFTYPIVEKSAEMAIDLLLVKVFRFFSGKGLTIKKILTGNGQEFTKFNNRYTLFLNEHQISHEVYAGKEKNWHGYIERYKKETLKRIGQLDLSDFEDNKKLIRMLNDDKKNAEKNGNGFPTFGLSPLMMINNYLAKAIVK